MTPKRKYLDHKGRSIKLRNIPFLLTYEEWLTIWQQSGHYHEMGRGPEQYCMSRINDEGPYAVGNVFIQQTAQNTKDYHKSNNRLITCVKCKKSFKPHHYFNHHNH